MRDIRKLYRTYRGLIISVTLTAFCLVSALFGVIPAARRVWSLHERVADLRKDVKHSREKLEILQSIDEKGLRDTLETLFSAVPQDKSITTVFSTVENTAQKAGVVISQMTIEGAGSISTESASPKKTAGKDAMKGEEIAFSLTATGSYSAIREFISRINRVRRIFSVENFDITIASGQPVRLKLGLRAYYHPVPEKIPGVSVAVAGFSKEDEEALVAVNAQYPDMTGIASLPSAPPPGELKSNPFARE